MVKAVPHRPEQGERGGRENAKPCGEMGASLSSPLTDIDECLRTPCQQRCRNSIGSYQCSCRAGFHLHSNRHSCIGELCGLGVVHLGCQSGRWAGQSGTTSFWTTWSCETSAQSTPIPCLALLCMKYPKLSLSWLCPPLSWWSLLIALPDTR